MPADFADLPTEDSIPDPEFLIKSIAEQGYSLETSLADLIDNSISANANKVEILVNTEEEPFMLFVADNGNGMCNNSLKKNMQFPSNSSSSPRDKHDLGRFGLGMKTASFAQTRKLTVISRQKGTKKYAARTWDVEYLALKKRWEIIINTDQEINGILLKYKELSKAFLNEYEDFAPNTIVVWHGLYKYDFIDDKIRKTALQNEINDITNEHLSIVFHRFMEHKEFPLKIRVNNVGIEPFNPFPTHCSDFRSIPYKHKVLSNDTLKIEGFVLPARSVHEVKQGESLWTTKSRSLMDMEGIYIYRSNRLIRFGGWNGIIKKSSKLQLARLMVEVGNNSDHLIHLNVAKSQIKIPFELKRAFFNYIEVLIKEAVKELHNIGNEEFSSKGNKYKSQLFEKKTTSRGVQLRINPDFPILNSLRTSLNKDQNSSLNIIVKMIEIRINKIKQVHDENSFTGNFEQDSISEQDLITGIMFLKSKGFTDLEIKDNVIKQLGFAFESLPPTIKKILLHE
jgi:hypothetical protein